MKEQGSRIGGKSNRILYQLEYESLIYARYKCRDFFFPNPINITAKGDYFMKYLLQANKKYGWLNRNPIMIGISRMLIFPAEVLMIYGKSAKLVAHQAEYSIRAATSGLGNT